MAGFQGHQAVDAAGRITDLNGRSDVLENNLMLQINGCNKSDYTDKVAAQSRRFPITRAVFLPFSSYYDISLNHDSEMHDSEVDIMRFLNRKTEMQRLEKMAFSSRKELLVLYGRRRLGKTTLLREFSHAHSALFFSCPLSTQSEALRLFQDQMAEVFGIPLLRETRFPGWPEAMRFAFQESAKQNIAIILDEFPYLLRSVAGIDAVIQHLWDETDDKIWLGLSGSLVPVMLERVLGSQAPLYGRRTEQIQLKPMSFRDVSLFYGKASFLDLAHWYAFFGGVPAYAERAAAYDRPQTSVCELVLNENGVLYQEPEFLVREELREPGAYFSILRSLAAGQTRPNAIAQDAGVLHSGVNKYLDTLRQMLLIERRVPLTEKHLERSTKAVYVLSDHFLRFWFRYVYPNRSVIELGRGAELFQSRIDPDLDNYMGPVFEDICCQEISQHGEDELGWQPLRIGRYWDRDSEIDIVAEDADCHRVAFFECKWGRHINVERTLFSLRHKSDTIPHYSGWERQHFVVSRTESDHPQHVHVG